MLRKSATKFLYVKTVSSKVAKYSLAYLSVQKFSLRENLAETDIEKRRFPISIRS